MPLPTAMKAVKLVKLVGRYSEGEDAVRACFQVVDDEPVPKPRYGQVLIRVRRAQINPSDTSFCQGRYGVKRDPPCVPGFEGAGVVVEHGGHPLAWRLMGKRVTFFSSGGGWAEYVVTDWSRCLSVGEAVQWKNAAGGLANPMTVMEMIRVAESRNHSSLMATAGASSLVLQLIKVAKRHGIASIAIVRKSGQLQGCLDAGAAVALDSTDPEFVQKLEEASKRLKCKLAFDSVAGEVGGQVLAALQDDGEVHCYGFLSGKPIPATGKDLIFRRKSLKGLWLNQALDAGYIKLYQMTSELVSLLDTDLSTNVRASFPLDDVAEALLTYTKDLSGGKIHLLLGEE